MQMFVIQKYKLQRRDECELFTYLFVVFFSRCAAVRVGRRCECEQAVGSLCRFSACFALSPAAAAETSRCDR